MLKILTWNINKAAYVRKELWDYIKQDNFDIALLQEVYLIPSELRKYFFVVRGEMTAILIRKSDGRIVRNSSFDKKAKLNSKISDFFVSCEVIIDNNCYTIINIYNYIGTTEKDFEQFLNMLYKYLRDRKNVLIGGDFNMNSGFQGSLLKWGNIAKKMIAKLDEFGYKNILPLNIDKKEFYTFLTPDKKNKYQLDYIFLPKNYKMTNVVLGDAKRIIFSKPRLSDHLPLKVEIKNH